MSFLNNILKGVKHIPFLGKKINRYATNKACNTTKPRPRAFSLWSHIKKPSQSDVQGPVGEYTSWPMLTDRIYSARHLPPSSQNYITNLPKDLPYKPDNIGEITALFERKGNISEGRSSVLFMFFAQWFTDSILRIDPTDRRKNTSNHNIDLCQIYGLTENTARILRSRQGGKLRSQMINGEEYLDYLGELDGSGNWKVKDHYKLTNNNEGLPYTADAILAKIFTKWPNESDNDFKKRQQKLYATGLERGNSSVGYVAISTLFMREHNRICNELSQNNNGWDDERLFQTARMINIVILMKLVVQNYINHIAGYDLFDFDPTFAEKQDWYRTPWIALEFDLLYRWHGLVRDNIKVKETRYTHQEYRFNNALLEAVGLGTIIDAASSQKAGEISLQNVPKFLLGAEYQMIKMGRDFCLRPYNDYRNLFGLKRLTSFSKLTDDNNLRAKLKRLYKKIDNVEYVIGLFAQKHSKNRLFGDLLNKMVAYDAFTQIYTNPLLSKNIYNIDTFTKYGLKLIKDTNSVQNLINRNIKNGSNVKASFSS